MPTRELDALDRHALVMAVWLPPVLAAAAAFHYGFAAGGWPFIGAGFAVLIAAFVGHVVINVILGTRFTPREVAFGLLIYCAGLLAFGFAILLSSSFQSLYVLPVSVGL